MSESAPRISDEAVEVQAKRDFYMAAGGVGKWEDQTDEVHEDCRTRARRHLTTIHSLLCGQDANGLTQGERDLDAERARQQHRADSLTQQLNQVREEVERAVLDCAEGTVTGAEKAQKRLEAILDSSSSVSGDGDLKAALETEEEAAIEFREARNRFRAALEEIRERATVPPKGPVAWTRVQWAADIADFALAHDTHRVPVPGCPCSDCTTNSGDVEGRGEEERLQRAWEASGGAGEMPGLQTTTVRLEQEELLALLRPPYENTYNGERADAYLRAKEKLKAASTQPNPEPHLSGDGERLEAIAAGIERMKGTRDDDLGLSAEDAAAYLRDLASRLSSEDSSGVGGTCQHCGRSGRFLVESDELCSECDSSGVDLLDRLERWMVDYEGEEGGPVETKLSWITGPDGDPTTKRPDVGEYLIRLRDAKALLTQPDSTTRLSEGTD